MQFELTPLVNLDPRGLIPVITSMDNIRTEPGCLVLVERQPTAGVEDGRYGYRGVTDPHPDVEHDKVLGACRQQLKH